MWIVFAGPRDLASKGIYSLHKRAGRRKLRGQL
jgi:hypothetical protein